MNKPKFDTGKSCERLQPIKNQEPIWLLDPRFEFTPHFKLTEKAVDGGVVIQCRCWLQPVIKGGSDV